MNSLSSLGIVTAISVTARLCLLAQYRPSLGISAPPSWLLAQYRPPLDVKKQRIFVALYYRINGVGNTANVIHMLNSSVFHQAHARCIFDNNSGALPFSKIYHTLPPSYWQYRLLF